MPHRYPNISGEDMQENVFKDKIDHISMVILFKGAHMRSS